MRNKPNFFIVGSAKSATTSIYNYLEKHKSVFMSPIKEPNFFSKDIEFNSFRSEYKRDLRHNPTNVVINHSAWIDHDEKYYSLFSKANSEKVIGEGSVSYLFSKLAPLEIYKENKDSKVLIILRNPIDRAYSHYLMNLKLGYASRSFLYEIDKDHKCQNASWGVSHLYIELGLYYEQVKRYFDVFPKEQILILFYDDLKNKQNQTFNKICDFLKIERTQYSEVVHSNISQVPKNSYIFIFAKKIYKLFPFLKNIVSVKKIKSKLYAESKPDITNSERAEIMKYFYEDIENLENLIGEDLGSWKAY